MINPKIINITGNPHTPLIKKMIEIKKTNPSKKLTKMLNGYVKSNFKS